MLNRNLYDEIMRESKRDPSFKEKIQQRLNTNPKFKEEFKVFYNGDKGIETPKINNDPTFGQIVKDGFNSAADTIAEAKQTAINAAGNTNESYLNRIGSSGAAAVGGLVKGIGQAAGGFAEGVLEKADDVTGEVVSRNYNQYVAPQIQKGIQYASNTDIGKQAIAEYQEAMKNPTTKGYVDGAFGVTGGLLAASGAGKVGQIATQGATSGAKGAVNSGLEYGPKAVKGTKNLAVGAVKAPVIAGKTGYNKVNQGLAYVEDKIADKVLKFSEPNKILYKAIQPTITKGRNAEKVSRNIDIVRQEIIKNNFNPKNLNELGDSIVFSKENIWKNISSKLNDNVTKINLQDIKNSLINYSKTPGVQRLSESDANSINKLAENLTAKGNIISVNDAQDMKMFLNAEIGNAFNNPNLSQGLLNAKKQIAKSLNQKINKAVSSFPDEYKNSMRRYGALSDILEDVNKRIIVNERKAAGGGIVEGFSRIEGSANVLSGLLTGKPREALKGAAQTIGGRIYGNLNDKDELVRRVFKNSNHHLSKSQYSQNAFSLNNHGNDLPQQSKLKRDLKPNDSPKHNKSLKTKVEKIKGSLSYKNNKTYNLARQGIKDEESGKVVNENFNLKLELLNEKNANSIIFSLGRPNSILKSAGIEDKYLKLYGNKITKKAKQHGFDYKELKSLPDAIKKPVAVFSTQDTKSFAILTNIKLKGKNTLVALRKGKGKDIDFNIVNTVYGKNKNSVSGWINTGKLKWVDKEKAQNYLGVPALNAGAINNKELISNISIIKNFKNSKGSFKLNNIIKNKISKISKVKKKALIERFKKSKNLQDFLESIKSNKLTKWELAAIYYHLQSQKQQRDNKMKK